MGASDKSDRAVVNEAPDGSSPKASIPCAVDRRLLLGVIASHLGGAFIAEEAEEQYIEEYGEVALRRCLQTYGLFPDILEPRYTRMEAHLRDKMMERVVRMKEGNDDHLVGYEIDRMMEQVFGR